LKEHINYSMNIWMMTPSPLSGSWERMRAAALGGEDSYRPRCKLNN
jgi:hypothetical protein